MFKDPAAKTTEELRIENASLKSALDALALQHERMAKEQMREKEVLKESIADFGRELRREAASGKRAVKTDADRTPARFSSLLSFTRLTVEWQ